MRVFLATLFVCLCFPALAQEEPQPPQHKIWLVLTYVTPGKVPDIREKFAMESESECWTEAMEFTKRGIPDKLKDHVIATMGACLIVPTEEKDM
jgi:hypothetical protein